MPSCHIHKDGACKCSPKTAPTLEEKLKMKEVDRFFRRNVFADFFQSKEPNAYAGLDAPVDDSVHVSSVYDPELAKLTRRVEELEKQVRHVADYYPRTCGEARSCAQCNNWFTHKSHGLPPAELNEGWVEVKHCGGDRCTEQTQGVFACTCPCCV